MLLITWNIQWALGADSVCDPARIVKEARRLGDFDVLCLQEVADGFEDLEGSEGRNQFAAFAELLPGFTPIEGIATELPAKNGDKPRWRFGNMMLSRLPVGRVLRHSLPWDADATQNMPRILIEAVVETRSGPLRVMTTHIEWSSAKLRAAQIEELRAIHRRAVERCRTQRPLSKGPYGAAAQAQAAILTGDFNMRPDDATIARLQEPIGDGVPPLHDAWRMLNPEAPHPHSFCLYDRRAGEPHCVDYILVSEDLSPRVRRVEYDQTSKASDHQPVLIEIAD